MWRPTPQGHHVLMSTSSTIAMKVAASDQDDRVVRKLAELDSSRPPQGPVVVALVDGRPVAAASLVDGVVVADPFVPSCRPGSPRPRRPPPARAGAASRSSPASGPPPKAAGSRVRGSPRARKGPPPSASHHSDRRPNRERHDTEGN